MINRLKPINVRSKIHDIIEKVPLVDVLPRAAQISMGERVRIVHIPPCALETGSKDVDAAMRQFDVISINVNEIPTQMIT